MESDDKFVLTSVRTVEFNDELVEASQYGNFMFTLNTVQAVKELKCSKNCSYINTRPLFKRSGLTKEKKGRGE